MKQSKVNLASHLQKTKRRRIITLVMLPITGILSIFIFNILLNLPWHTELFLRWLLRGGDVTHIPEKFYKELNELCYTSNTHGVVDGYQGSLEIAYALGKFRCHPSSDGDYWIIEDTYAFASPDEASPGSKLAVLLVSILGTNYSYKIQSIVPMIKE